MHPNASGFTIHPSFKKLLMVAKLTLLILALACGSAMARLSAQTVTLKVKNEKLEKVFKEIKRQTGYDYVFNTRFAAEAKTVSVDINKADLNEALRQCFENQPFTYEVVDKIIVIKEKPATKPEQKNTEAVPLALMPPPPPYIIKGKIVDDKGEPVIGASIKAKETGELAVADNSGNFTIEVKIPKPTLQFTSIGHETREIAYDGKSFVSLIMRVQVNELDQMVIIAYGQVSKRLNTGSVSTVSADMISKSLSSDPIAALEGNVPGMLVTQNSGTPGRKYNVQLRGQNSIANGNDPLYLVDGVPFNSTSIENTTTLSLTAGSASSPFSYLNPADIESIEVLKDADQTAIYGSRGANGVVLITTKKGKTGKTRVDANVYTGAGQITKSPTWLNTTQYLQMRHEAFRNDGVTVLPANAYDLNGKWDTTRYTDWQKLLIGGTQKYTDVQIALSGGNANTQFLIGGGLHRETSVLPGDFNDTKASGHISINHSSTDNRFKASLSAFYTVENSLYPISDITGFVSLAPDAPAIYDSVGKLNWQGASWTNPYRYLLQTSKSNSNYFNGSLNISYEILHGLVAKADVGFANNQLNQIQKFPQVSYDPSSTTLSSSQFAYNSRQSWIVEPQLSYTTSFKKHNLSLLAGSTLTSQITNSSAFRGTGYTTDALLENLLAASVPTVGSVAYADYEYLGIFGRATYNYAQKYILNLTARRDGSSRFGPGKQYANFGSVGAAWIFSSEKFVRNNLPFISFGKLRTSFGITGNDQIGDYQFLDTYNPSTAYQGVATLSPQRLANSDYAWEKDKELEFGLELGLFKDRVQLTANYFKNRTSNQLLNYTLPYMTGFTNIIANLPAIVQNNGIEIQLNTTNVRNKNFLWTSSFNITIPSNKLVDFPNLSTSSYASSYVVGQPLSISKQYQFTGVDPQTGLYTFLDVNKDGVISSAGDRQTVVFTGRQFYGGLTNSLQYKGFQLDFMLQFTEQKNGTQYRPGIPGTLVNQLSIVLNRWQAAGDVTDIQKFTNSNSATSTAYNNMLISTNTYSDASYIRLRNLRLSYQIPGSIQKSLHLQNASVYLQAQNLFTITSYYGFDPETKNLLPPQRVIAGGIKISL